MEKIIVITLAIAAIFLIGWPARALGKKIYENGFKDQCKWKVDLGSAIYIHGFRLTIAIVALFTILIPRIFGLNIFS